MGAKETRERAAYLGYRDGLDGLTSPVYVEVAMLSGASDKAFYRILRNDYDLGFSRGKVESSRLHGDTLNEGAD